MFKRWTTLLRALARADAARDRVQEASDTRDRAELDRLYDSRLRELHEALTRLDGASDLARIAAWIIRNEARER